MKVTQCLLQISDARFVLTVRLNDGLPKTISISGQKPFRFNGVIAKPDRADIIGVLNTVNEIEVNADGDVYTARFDEDCLNLFLYKPMGLSLNSDAIIYPFKELE